MVKMAPSQSTCCGVTGFLRAHHKDGVGYRQVMLGVQLIFSSRRKWPSGSRSGWPADGSVEVAFVINAEFTLREILEMTPRRENLVAPFKIFGKRFGFRRRFDDDK